VDGAGNEFLAGAGFAEDENGGIGGADSFEFLEDFLQRAAFADDLVDMEVSSISCRRATFSWKSCSLSVLISAKASSRAFRER